MSTQFIAAIVSLLVFFLPKFGIEIGSEELTQMVSGIVLFVSQVWIMYQRTKLQKASMGLGDVTNLGMRK